MKVYSKYAFCSLCFTLKTVDTIFSIDSTTADLFRGHIARWHLSSIMALIKTLVIAE